MANDLTGQIIDADHFPDRISDAKELVAHGSPENAHVGTAVHVVLRKDGTLIHIPPLDFEVLR